MTFMGMINVLSPAQTIDMLSVLMFLTSKIVFLSIVSLNIVAIFSLVSYIINTAVYRIF